ncbi:MAG: efflux RND transporter periplasmic adaptor subunit [Granulosicoccus sp.]
MPLFNFLYPYIRLMIVIGMTATTVSSYSMIASAQGWGDVENGGHDCLIEPYVIADVGSSTQGIVSRLLADRGSTVKKGQAIAQLESSMEQAATEQAAARAEMLGELVTRKADLELARLDSDRFSDLFARGLAPAQQRDEAAAREKIADAALVQAQENHKLLVLELNRTRRVLEQRTIKSPVNGVVVNQLVFPGELVLDNPIMTVAQLDPLRVEVVLPSRLFGTIKPDGEAYVYTEIETEEPLLAHVDVVDPLLDSRSGTFGVRLLLSNTDLDVPAGQKCQVKFQAGEDGAGVPATRPTQADVEEPAALGAAAPPARRKRY